MEETKAIKDDGLDNKRNDLINFLKAKKDYVFYVLLAVVLWIGAFIRTRSIPNMIDSVTGKYAPAALDPDLFLRYARIIVEQGSLPVIDTMRFFPVGKAMNSIEVILPYVIAYMYKIASIFSKTVTLEYIDVIYPAVFFVLATILFFFLVKRLFNGKIAILSTAFLAVIPAFLYRTMAGISDKEALGIFFMFGAFYFYVRAWQSSKIKFNLIWALLAGLFTGFLGLTWGGVKFALIIIAIFTLVEMLLSKFTKKDFYIYSVWTLVTVFMLSTLITKYGGLKGMLSSFSSGIAVLVFVVALVDFFIFKIDILNIKSKIEHKLPLGIASFILAIILSIIGATVIFGPSFILQQVSEIFSRLLHPLGLNRWLVTVAENHQPYFTDWLGYFKKSYFIILFVGSIFLFYKMISPLKKHKLKLTAAYIIFLSLFIFSRYSSGSAWNGTSASSKFAYFGSLIGFISILGIFYMYSYYKDKELFDQVLSIDKRYIFIFIWFFLMIVAARGAVRLFFVFAPITTIIAAYLFCEAFDITKKKIKTKYIRYALYIVLALILLNPIGGSNYDGLLVDFAKDSYNQAIYSGLSYGPQWSLAMKWVRENTPKDAIFSHWWDYGYWVQTWGERTTFLDGGNSFVGWDYFFGRHVMTAQSEDEALELLKTFNASYYLIDPTDIGKYTAFSSIGSDEGFDRYSWVGAFVLDPQQTSETRNATLYAYTGGSGLDDGFVYQGKVFPGGGTGIHGFILPITRDNGEVRLQQPTAVLSVNGQRIDIPLQCVYIENKETHFSDQGLPGCLVIIPAINNGQVNEIGAALYLTDEGTRALWAQLYLLNRKFDNFKEVYNDKDQMPLALYNGRQIGPLRIWEISYPPHIQPKEEYLEGVLPEWF